MNELHTPAYPKPLGWHLSTLALDNLNIFANCSNTSVNIKDSFINIILSRNVHCAKAFIKISLHSILIIVINVFAKSQKLLLLTNLHCMYLIAISIVDLPQRPQQQCPIEKKIASKFLPKSENQNYHYLTQRQYTTIIFLIMEYDWSNHT